LAEDSIESGIGDHTFGSSNRREYFHEDELTLGKKRYGVSDEGMKE